MAQMLEKRIIKDYGAFHQWGIFDTNLNALVAVVTADPRDGEAFKVTFIEETVTACLLIVEYIKEESENGGFKE